MKKETVDALMAQREMMQGSLDEAIRSVSERVWDEAVAACAEQGTIQTPENPYTVEAVERAKREAEQWERE